VAGALAALDLLESRPELVDRLAANSIALREELELEGFELLGGHTPIVSVVLGDAALAGAVAEAALARGAFVQPIGPPVTPAAGAGVRLTVMASHRPGELRAAARVLALATRDVGFDPGAGVAAEAAASAAGGADAAPATAGVFDYEARAA
jgi:7-keto-8-aminopelargonate synthetase-like enzyme